MIILIDSSQGTITVLADNGFPWKFSEKDPYVAKWLTGLLSHLLQDHRSELLRSSELIRIFPSMSSFASPEKKKIKKNKNIRSVEKRGCHRPALIFLVITSPQQLLGGFEWNMSIRLASVTFTTERICHTCEEFTRICYTCEKFERILHRCDKYVRILHTSKLDICEKLVPIKISKLVVRIFHTYQNVTYSCE